MQVNREWINISDMMAGLMMVFLFIAILFMDEIQKEQAVIRDIAENYEDVKKQLNRDLYEEFKEDLVKWDAEILPDNTVRFKSPDILFDTGSSVIKLEFTKILDDFFPRYLNILTSEIYQTKITEVRIEGHTSTTWEGVARADSYLHNLELSQERAREVLAYTYKITMRENRKKWLEQVFRANGMSFANLIKKNGIEDMLASQRVEFRVLTKAEEKIGEIIERLR